MPPAWQKFGARLHEFWRVILLVLLKFSRMLMISRLVEKLFIEIFIHLLQVEAEGLSKLGNSAILNDLYVVHILADDLCSFLEAEVFQKAQDDHVPLIL